MRTGLSSLLIGMVFAGILIGPSPPTEATTETGHNSPTAVVRATLDAVFHILEDPTLKPASQATQRRHLLEQVIAERFDYEEMSKRTLVSRLKSQVNTPSGEPS